MERNVFETLSEAIDEFESSTFRAYQDIVMLPPSNDPFTSDEEDGDDDIGLAGNLNLPADVSGAIEIHHRCNDGNNKIDKELPKGNQKKWKEGTKVFKNDWYKATGQFNMVEEFPYLVDLHELEFYKLFFDREVEQLFLDCTNKYAMTQRNNPSLSMNTEDLWDFFTIITFPHITFDHNLPCIGQMKQIYNLPLLVRQCQEITSRKLKHIYMSVTMTS